MTLGEKIKGHPATSEWLKNAIQAAQDRDIVDALHDAISLVAVLEEMVNEQFRAALEYAPGREQAEVDEW